MAALGVGDGCESELDGVGVAGFGGSIRGLLAGAVIGECDGAVGIDGEGGSLWWVGFGGSVGCGGFIVGDGGSGLGGVDGCGGVEIECGGSVATDRWGAVSGE